MATNTDGREEIKPVAPTEQTKWRDPSLVGKYMVDPKTGLAGLFRSPDNGETWVLTDTVYGHVYNQDEVDNIWDNGAGHKVADEIKSATADLPNVRKQADEAVKFAESAIAASKVNSDAIVAQSEAISEAKSAMDSATAEIQQLKANAASDAAKIRADVARVQSEVDTTKAANSASVEALKSDIGSAKKDLADIHNSLDKAQSAIEQNQKLINDSVAKITSDVSATKQDLADVHDSLTKAQAAAEQNQKAIDKSIAQINDSVDATNQDLADVRKDLTKAQADITANQKSINDNVAQINANITQDRKDIASAQQANEDTAKQLDDYSKQAAAQGKTIKSIQDKQDGFTATLADVQGNVAQVSDKVDGLSASLKDTQGNVASVKAQADQLSATLTDHGKAIATLTASTKELSSTLEDADGRLSKVEQTAQTNSSTLSDVQGDLSQVKQDATTLTATLKDAQGNISTLQQKADSVSAQLASAQGDIATLQTGIDGVKAILTSHDKSIHTLQADSKSLKDSMVNAQGDISTLRKTATDVTSELEDHTGRLSKVEQTASKQETTLSNLQGNLSQVEQKADSNTTTISSINKNAMQDRGVITDTNTSFDSLTHLGTYSIKAIGLPKMPEQHYGTLAVSGSAGSGWISQQFVADTTGNVYTRVFSNNAWSAWKQGGSQDAINQVKQTADSNSATIRNVQGDVSTLKQTATGIKSTLASHEGDIHTLQSDSKALQDDMKDAKGNISSLQKTSTSLVSEFRDHDGRLSKVEQTASTLVNEFADQQGHLNRVEQTAQGTQQTVANQQGQINNIKTDAAGIHETLTGQGNQIANIKVTLNGLSSKYEGVSGDLGKLKSSTMQDRGTVTSPDFNSLTQAGYYTVTMPINGKNYPTGSWGTLEVSGQTSDSNGRLNQKYVSDNNAETYVRQYNANTKSWTAWIKTANQNDVTALSNRITTNSTQITQNKKEIDLKADQSTVDNLSGEVSQNKAQLKVQAGQISSKVSSTDFKTLNDKVANMKIGGRNLLHGTSDQWWKFTSSGWGCFTTAQSSEVSTAEYHTGNVFTYSATISNNGKHDVALQLRSLNIQKKPISYYGSAHVKPGQQNMRVSCTAPVDTNTWYMSVWVYFPNNDGSNDIVCVKEEQLEEGNVQTPWTPNPDDLITSISNNSTAIDQTNQKISLKADQTEVDQIKDTATQNSSRLNVMADEIQSKVTSTDVDNIINGKGYATTSTVQSLITQKAGTINESITNLEGKFNSSSSVNLAEKTNQGTTNWMCDPGTGATNLTEVNINGVRGVRFNNTRKTTSWWVAKYVLNLDYFEPNQDYIISFDIRTSSDNFNQGGMLNIARGNSSHAYLANISFKTNFKQNQLTHVSCTGHSYSSLDKNGETFYLNCTGLGQCDWVDIVNFKIARGKIDKGYSPAPSDNATVTQLQSVTASIDGLQSRVTNYQNDTSSKYTQLSNLMQSKVGTADFEQLKRSVDMQTLDSADINNMKTNGHYFVHNLANNPIGGWVYVDVTGDGKYRIRQDVYQDSWNKHKFRRWYGDHWTNWEEGATYSEITQLQDAINLRVQKGELLSQINLTAGNTLIQSNKLYLDASSVVITGTAFIPSAAIASLSADKITTGLLNTNNINLGDGRTRLMADHDNFYIQPAGSASSNSGIRMGYDSLSFMTNDIPNGYGASVPYYSINYDGSSNGSLNIQTFDHINPGGATSTQNWYSMSGLISLSKKQIDFATNNNIHMHIDEGGVTVRPTLYFGNSTWNGTWAGFTRLDNSNTVEFNTGDNDGENFHVNSGARFMKYVYFNDYCRAQGWLTYSTLSKKTNIKKLDTSLALDKIRQDDQYLYEYKRNVAKGVYDPQASFIIDDVNDVSHYSVPREFIDQTGKYREPSVELSYLIAAFQEIDKQVQKQKEEIKELKEKLQHE